MSSVDSLRPPTIVIDMIEPDVAPILGGESQAMTDESAHSVPISANQSGIFREFASATMLKMLFHDQSM